MGGFSRMNPMESVLVLVRCPEDLEGPLETAAWLVRATGARLELLVDRGLHGGTESLEKRLKELGVPRFAMQIQVCDRSSEECLARHPHAGAGMRIMVTGSLECGSDSGAVLDPATVALIESTLEPVLLIPFGRKVVLPWPQIVAPMSGEVRINPALARAIELGNQLRLPVDIVHVIDSSPSAEQQAAGMGRFGDDPQHQLPKMVEEFVSRACPYCTPGERHVIREFRLSQGDPTTELLRALSGFPVGLVAVEWKGSFMRGHAETLKALLSELGAPVLLVRQSGEDEAALRAGHRLAG